MGINCYNRYKSLKNSFNIFYKGYDLKSIIADDFIFCSYGQRDIVVNKDTLKYHFTNCLDFTELKTDLLHNNSVVFSFSNYGTDHRKTLEAIMMQVENSILLKDIYKTKTCFSLTNIIFTFYQIFVISFKGIKISIKEKLYFYQRTVFYKNTIDSLENQIKVVNSRYFVPFLSPMFKDNLYCQFFRKQGIKSYGIQHGLHLSEYFYYKKNIPLDIVNIENFQADYFLAWGEFMKDVFKSAKLDEARCLIAGNPKYFETKRINLQNTNFKQCIVCLARDYYLKENKELIKIAAILKQNGFNIILKLHPRSNENNYIDAKIKYGLEWMDKSISVEKSIEIYNPDFVIIYNSTTYYDYYVNNIIALRFGLNECDIPFGLNDVFNNFDELILLLLDLKQRNNTLFNQEINEFINKFSLLGVNNYGKILNIEN